MERYQARWRDTRPDGEVPRQTGRYQGRSEVTRPDRELQYQMGKYQIKPVGMKTEEMIS